MRIELDSWLDKKSTQIRDRVLYLAPNMLPDAESIDTFLVVLDACIGEPTQMQLAFLQSWSLANIGRDTAVANDWLTILRTLKEVILETLKVDYPLAQVFEHLHTLDHIFTYAIIEVTKLTSDLDRATQLEHMVNLRREMSRLNQNKSDFVSVAAHELRTPLTLLDGYAGMMRSMLPKGSESLVAMLDGFDGGIKRLGRIIGDMIDVSMIDAGTFKISFQQVHLNKLIKILAGNMQKHFDARKVSLTIEPFVFRDAIYGDPERLTQAFERIFANALKYTPDGGQVVVRDMLSRPGEVTDLIAGYVQVEIKDTGIGIKPENLDTIFEKFSSMGNVANHSSGTIKFKGGGPGLGLPIVRGIIEAHRGRVWAESKELNEKSCPGSTFRVELPIFTAPPTK